MWVHVRMEGVFIPKPIAFALLYAFQQKRLDYITNKKKLQTTVVFHCETTRFATQVPLNQVHIYLWVQKIKNCVSHYVREAIKTLQQKDAE